ncbi:hypothetical protein Spa11_25240 [Botrimarina mediterranea]|uniref:Translocation protein TolB n=2 Tax=Botrimarina mediterranea TaxID=2528022 RepID=A0A518K950_9BACT|nr:hypothetical protein Spa11_25240 [Botrimarina mediterranea]
MCFDRQASADGLDEFAISTYSAFQQFPDVSGQVVVWEDGRGAASGTEYDIYGKDLGTGVEFSVTTATGSQYRPVISGDVVVWEDYRNGGADIYAKNLSTGVEFPISTASRNQRRPQIDGNLIVWQDERNGGSDIYGFDLLTNMEFVVSSAVGDQFRPAISGDTVIWVDSRNRGVQGLNLSTSTAYAINNTFTADFRGPAIDGETVVWMGVRDGVEGLYRTDLTTGDYFLVRAQSETSQLIQTPVIEGSTILWGEGEGGAPNLFDIYGEDFTNGNTFFVSNAAGGQYYPAIDNGLIVWTDGRSNQNSPNIYGAVLPTIPEPTNLALVAMLAGWGLVRRRRLQGCSGSRLARHSYQSDRKATKPSLP